MDLFNDFLNKIENIDNKNKVKSLLENRIKEFPNLKPIIAWNQPMFTNQDTYIIGFSVSKNHLAIAPEAKYLEQFKNDIKYETSKQLIKIKWNEEIDYDLIKKIIKYNVEDKTGYKKFWRS